MESTDLLENLCTFAGEWRTSDPTWPSASDGRPDPLGTLGYFAHVLTHPLTLTLLASFGVSALITGSLFLAATLLCLPIACLLLVRARAVRDVIDGQRHATVESRIGRTKSTLKLRMHGAHRIELSRLESIASALRERAPTATARRWIDEYLGLDHLVCCYADLALAYRAREGRLTTAVGPSVPLRPLNEELMHPAQSLRLQVERIREQNLARLRRELNAITHLLGAISSYVRLLHEASVRTIHLDRIHEDIAAALEGWSILRTSTPAELPLDLVEALEVAIGAEPGGRTPCTT